MRAISRYKEMVEEVGRMLGIFAGYESNKHKGIVDLGRWTTDVIKSMQANVMNYAGEAAAQIKEELIGDGDVAKYKGRLKTAFFELGADPYFTPSYFPCFDEALFELPNKDEPDKNRTMAEVLANVYGSEREAKSVMVSLQAIAQWANIMVQDVAKMLDDVCNFVGYTPEPQDVTNIDTLAGVAPEPQQNTQELATPEAKELINKAIAANLIEKTPEGLKWKGTKVLCAYFADRASHSLNLSNKMDKEGNITTSWKPFEALFGIDRLKDAKQNWMRLNTKFEPTGFEKVDALM